MIYLNNDGKSIMNTNRHAEKNIIREFENYFKLNSSKKDTDEYRQIKNIFFHYLILRNETSTKDKLKIISTMSKKFHKHLNMQVFYFWKYLTQSVYSSL